MKGHQDVPRLEDERKKTSGDNAPGEGAELVSPNRCGTYEGGMVMAPCPLQPSMTSVATKSPFDFPEVTTTLPSSPTAISMTATGVDDGFSAKPGCGSFPPVPPSFHGKDVQRSCEEPRKKSRVLGVEGLLLKQCGGLVNQRLLEVLSLRSQSTVGLSSESAFPMPTSRELLVGFDPALNDDEIFWTLNLCLSLNSLWGGELHFDGKLNKAKKACLGGLIKDVRRFCSERISIEPLEWGEFFKVRGIDYKGDEVKVAMHFSWKNLEPALPKEVGAVALEDVCSLGCKHYVEHFEAYLKPREQWDLPKAPRVMVSDADWPAVCAGLVSSGICKYISEHDIFDTGSGPLLNGLFGVTKEEWTPSGTEIFRLIMNLVPLNGLCQPLAGDVDTLPNWGMMNPFFLQPSESLLVSSEDVKCFFYTMRVRARELEGGNGLLGLQGFTHGVSQLSKPGATCAQEFG